MCTLVVAAQIFPDHPLVIVANRDEQLDRASSPPSIWPQGFLAPRDDVAGGTWLGVNGAGVFVGITNRFLGPKDPARASRGELVANALALGSAREIHEAMAKVPASRHNGFHLVYADARDVLATASTGEHIAQLSLGKGIHAITERSFGAGDDSLRLRRIHAAWAARVPSSALESGCPSGCRPASPDLRLERLTSLLTEHDDADPLAATCIHVAALRYGTRSSAAIAIASDKARSRMLWAEGPPCTTPFVPFALLCGDHKNG